MYHLFTGKLPSGRYPDPSELNPDVSEELNQLILECLQEDPNHGPDSAEELKIRLLAIPQGAHVNEEQKLRAEQGFTSFKSKLLLLDVLREDRFGGVYLCQQK